MNRVLLIAWLAFAPLAALAQDGVVNPQTDASKLTTGTLPVARLGGLSAINNSLGGDVNLSNTGSFFDGPSVAQGSSGTWWASGQVVVTDTALASIFCKLWDGSTTISSGAAIIGANTDTTIAMSGFLASPAGNIRISCNDASTVNGKILATPGGIVTKAGTVSAFRVQ